MGQGTTGRPAGLHVCFTPDRVALTAGVALRATRDTPASSDASEKCDVQQIGAPFQNRGTRWGRSWMQRRIYCPTDIFEMGEAGMRCACSLASAVHGERYLARHSHDWRTRARQRCCRRPLRQRHQRSFGLGDLKGIAGTRPCRGLRPDYRRPGARFAQS
jgi:hypothetical protein